MNIRVHVGQNVKDFKTCFPATWWQNVRWEISATTENSWRYVGRNLDPWKEIKKSKNEDDNDDNGIKLIIAIWKTGGLLLIIIIVIIINNNYCNKSILLYSSIVCVSCHWWYNCNPIMLNSQMTAFFLD